MEPWVKVLMLTLGGALGVNARYWLGDWMSRWSSPLFPWATFTINITGSFAIGFLAVVLARWLPHPHVRMLVIVGFLGGYTTFSSYAYESLILAERGEVGLALAYVTGSVILGLIAVTIGVALAGCWARRRDPPGEATITIPAQACPPRLNLNLGPAQGRLHAVYRHQERDHRCGGDGFGRRLSSGPAGRAGASD